MEKYSINSVSIFSFFIFSFFSCETKTKIEKASRVDNLPYYKEATFTPHWFGNSVDSLINFHRIANFELINQDSNVITNKTLKNKIYVADFFFASCPGICPKMTKNMKIIQDEIQHDDDVLILSHSVTPERDSVHILKHYAVNNEIISGKWHLLTGDRKQIYNLGRKSYFIEEDLGLEKEEDEFLHTENFVLVDKNGYLRGIYNGLNKTAIQQLIVDINTLKQE